MFEYTVILNNPSQDKVKFRNIQEAEDFYKNHPEATQICLTEQGQVLQVLASREMIFG